MTGLKPGKCYEFEIVAINKEGESPAAKIDEPVFTLEGSSTFFSDLCLKLTVNPENFLILTLL